MEKVQKLNEMMNKDWYGRQIGSKTKPFEKQKIFAQLYPSAALKNAEHFYLNENYFPENSRDKIDMQNKETVILNIEELKKANSFKQDTSMQRTA